MKADFVLLGRHFNMAPRINRRRLVTLIYAAFAALMAAGWFLDHWHVWGLALIVMPASYVGRLVLGGYGVAGKGMVKPFLGNEVRARYIENRSSSWSRMAKSNIPNLADDRQFCSDEREVGLRDKAHQAAYRYLGAIVIITLMIACLKYAAMPALQEYGIDLSPAFLDQIIYGLLIASAIMLITLPQSILLWTEPDIDEEEA
jgi:hypothetical protein